MEEGRDEAANLCGRAKCQAEKPYPARPGHGKRPCPLSKEGGAFLQSNT